MICVDAYFKVYVINLQLILKMIHRKKNYSIINNYLMQTQKFEQMNVMLEEFWYNFEYKFWWVFDVIIISFITDIILNTFK